MYFVRPVTKHFSLFLHTDTLSREITNLFKPLLLVFQSGTILKLVCCNNNFLSYFQSFKMPPRWCISALAWKIVLIFYPSLSLSHSQNPSLNSLFQLATAILGLFGCLSSLPQIALSLYHLSCPYLFYHLSCSIICPVLFYQLLFSCSIICPVLSTALSCNLSSIVLSSVLFCHLSYSISCPFSIICHVLPSVLFYHLSCPELFYHLSSSVYCPFHVLSSVLFYQLPCLVICLVLFYQLSCFIICPILSTFCCSVNYWLQLTHPNMF